MSGPWEKYKTSSTSNKPWEKYASSAQEPGVLETIAGKAASGASLGFVDELAGGLEAGGQAIGLKGLGGKLKDIGLSDEGPTLDYDTLKKAYQSARNAERGSQKAMSEARPGLSFAAEMAGGMALPLSGAASLGGRVAQSAGMGAAAGLGNSTANDLQGMAGDVAIGAGFGAAAQGLGEKVIAPAANWAVNKAGNLFGNSAENLAMKALGVTGAQRAKMDPKTGRYLLDNELIGFGDDVGNIASKLEKAKEGAGSSIESALQGMDKLGATASVDDIISKLQEKVVELKRVPGNDATINQIEKELERLAGKSSMPLSVAEQAKRNFQGQVNYFSPEYERKGAASVADAFRQEVEKQATSSNPELAKQFLKAKSDYGMIAPAEEYASKRAATAAQSQFGGMGDMVAGGAGAAAGGFTGGLASVLGKHFLLPRAASSGAVTADKISKALQANPGAFGRFSQALSNAAARGQEALSATHFLLQNQNQEYREMMRNSQDGNQ